MNTSNEYVRSQLYGTATSCTMFWVFLNGRSKKNRLRKDDFYLNETVETLQQKSYNEKITSGIKRIKHRYGEELLRVAPCFGFEMGVN